MLDRVERRIPVVISVLDGVALGVSVTVCGTVDTTPVVLMTAVGTVTDYEYVASPSTWQAASMGGVTRHKHDTPTGGSTRNVVIGDH